MLKCVQSKSSEFITILDPQWRARLVELRALSDQNLLVCPACHQPVRARLGKYRCWHFAHKHLQNCLFQNESALLLNTRAVLYEWLVEHYGAGKVFVEKVIPGLPFPRHIDCWIEGEPTPILYWIFDTRRSPQERNFLKEAFQSCGAQAHVIFTASLLHYAEMDQHHVFLTTTEREFLESTPFDRLARGYAFSAGKSLNYLDEHNNTFTTYRNLHLVHSPQEFAGSFLTTALSKVYPVRETGDICHPGEQESFVKQQDRTAKLQEKQQRVLPQLLKRSSSPSSDPGIPISPSPAVHPVQPSKIIGTPFSKPAICSNCGNLTSDWITFDGKTGTCICRNCYNKGVNETPFHI